MAAEMLEGLLFGLFEGGFKVSSGAASWYGSGPATDVDNSETASPVVGHKTRFRADILVVLRFGFQQIPFRTISWLRHGDSGSGLRWRG